MQRARWVLLLVSAMLSMLLASQKDLSAEGPVLPRSGLDAARGGARCLRPAVAAGPFYPADPVVLYRDIERMMASAEPVGLRGVRAIVVPHACYVYSGEVAAASYREVSRDFRRVFLLASNHSSEEDFAGAAIPEETHFAVPGAEIPLSAVLDELAGDPLFVSRPAAHAMHMLELQLPFLWHLRGKPTPVDFTIAPVILGRMEAGRSGGWLVFWTVMRTTGPCLFSVSISPIITRRLWRASWTSSASKR